MQIGALRYLGLMVICIMCANYAIDYLKTNIATMGLSPQVECNGELKTLTRVSGELTQYRTVTGELITCKEP